MIRPAEIVRMKFELDVVAGRKADEVEPVLTGGAGDAAMSVGQFDAIGAVLENFDHRAPGVIWLALPMGKT